MDKGCSLFMCALALVMPATRSAGALQYRIVNCGALPGAVMTASGGLSAGWDINNRGVVVGASTDAQGHQHGIIWDQENGMREVRIGSSSTLTAHDINDDGLFIVDSAYLSDGSRPPVQLLLYDLNNRGQAVGEYGSHACLWNPDGGVVDLGVPPGKTNSWAIALNNAAQAVGDSISWPGGYRAFIWDSIQGIRDLGVLPGFTDSHVRDINDAGQVVGSVSIYTPAGGAVAAFIWDQEHGMRPIESLGLPQCEVTGINNRGQIIGCGNFLPDRRPWFVWDSVSGISLLDTLGGQFSYLHDINDNGWIVGESDDAEGNRYACVWIPVAEPSGLAGLMLALSLTSAFALRRGRYWR